MDDRIVKEDAPVDFPFRPGKDVLPGKGEWYKRNNVFFRDKVGELSDLYDTCSKVSEKREIARLVVEAVYENGGRFLDADGNDIGYKRSMDKAMKALKDRRHIKSRKLVSKPHGSSQSAQAIKKDVHKKRAEVFATAAAKKSSPKAPKRVKDPLSTDDAGHALLLLRNAAEEVDRSESEDEQPRLPPNKRKPFLESRERQFPLASALRKTLAKQDSYRGYRQYNEPIMDGEFQVPRRRSSDRSQGSNYSERRTPSTQSTTPSSTQPPSPQVQAFAKAPPTMAKEAEQRKDKPKEGNGGMPVLWQSVIVSRERPQASLADMLVNAKQRLDALSSIQQAVSAPICLIYPPSHGLQAPASQMSAAYPGQVSMGQIPLGNQVQLTQYPLRQEFFQSASRSGVLGSGL